MAPFTAELIGTMLLILIGEGVVANVALNKTFGHNSGWLVITTAWALAVYIGVIVAGPVSGAHLNPAVTIGLAAAGKFPWARVPAFIAAQFIGAMTGAFLVWLLYKNHFDETHDAPEAQLAVFCTSPAIRNSARNFLSELIGTFVLVYVIFHFSNPVLNAQPLPTPIGMGSLGAIPVAFLVWGIGLALGGTTGYAINPARDLGPRIMHSVLPMKGKGSTNWQYAYIPVLGPVAGALTAALLFLYIG